MDRKTATCAHILLSFFRMSSNDCFWIDNQIFIIFFKELSDTLEILQATMASPENDAKGSEETVAHEYLSFFLSFLRSGWTLAIVEIRCSVHGEIGFNLLWSSLKPRSSLCMRSKITSKPLLLCILEQDCQSRWKETLLVAYSRTRGR